MAPQARIGGIIAVKVNGELLYAKGNFTYNTGATLKTMLAGADRIHGFTEKPQVPFLEGEITEHSDVDHDALVNGVGDTVTCNLANGKTFVLRGAVFAAEGTGNTEEGNLGVRWEGLTGTLI